jgi:hypothetical protein
VGYVACMGEIRIPYNIFFRKPERKSNPKDPGIDGRIISE